MAVTITPLAERVAAASSHPPLSDLSPGDRRELEALLGTAASVEDLPGRWQAALLAAESGGAGAPAGHCCGHH